MSNWLANHPKTAAWIIFPIAPILMVIGVVLDFKEHWRWVSSSLQDFRRDSADTIKHAAKQLVRFYKNYPEVLIANLDLINQGDSYTEPPKMKSKGPQ